MNFTSLAFLFLFLPITAIVYYIIPKQKTGLRNTWLLLTSLGFYAWGEPVYVLLLLASIVVNYFMGLWIEKYAGSKKGKGLVALGVALNVVTLCIFKYGQAILSGIGYVIRHDFSSLNIVLPLGISYYTFQAISYLVDIYRRKAPAQRNVLGTGLYLALFIKLVQGPLVKYHEFERQMHDRVHSIDRFSQGVCRFAVGAAKKTILASALSTLVSEAFGAAPGELSVVLAWAGAFGYLLQIYFDFSGYTDMAIGLGLMFGFDVPENFNYPYIAKSVGEYWRRWHMTLGAWFRDYVYYPLTLGPAIKMRKVFTNKFSRKAGMVAQNVFTLLIIWSLTGIWHGNTVNYLLWGLINFAFILWETLRKPIEENAKHKALGWAYTFLVALLTKPLVVASSLPTAINYYAAMFGLMGNALVDAGTLFWLRESALYLAVGTLFAFPTFKRLQSRLENNRKPWARNAYGVGYMVTIAMLMIISVALVLSSGYSPFIYQNF